MPADVAGKKREGGYRRTPLRGMFGRIKYGQLYSGKDFPVSSISGKALF